MNYNHLFYFYEVAKFGSISKAAKHLTISQPSLSIQIKTLEDNLGFRLFEKKGRSIALTERGQKVYLHCSRVFQSTQELFYGFDKKEVTKNFTIGISPEVDSSLILETSQKVNTILKMKLKIKLISKMDFNLEDGGNSSDISLYITNKSLSSSSKGLLSLYKTIKIPVNLFQSQVHKAKEKNLIMPSKSFSLRDETDLYLKQVVDEKFDIQMESDFISSLIFSVINGYGVAFLPISYMLDSMQEGLVLKYGPKKGYWLHKLNIYWSNEEQYQQWIKHFVILLMKTKKV
ncbi:MAG: LysR family transcriptional regulator [Bdellovibrionaceae bacterium]|nr:LysR family transcriptional regulator [Pseudobdellovibrionaceae bacterium]